MADERGRAGDEAGTVGDVARAWAEAMRAVADGAGLAEVWTETARAWADAALEGTAREALERHLAQTRALFEMGEALLEAQRRATAGGQAWRETLEEAVAPLRRRMTEILAAGLPRGGETGAVWETLLQAPPVGCTREWQEKLQTFARAQRALEEAWAAFRVHLEAVGVGAARRFGERLAARAETGEVLTSLRGLYDLWVDAAEEAYAEVVATEAYSEDYGRLLNAAMALRRAQRVVGDEVAGALDLPARTELDGAHRRVHVLRGRVRALEAELAALREEMAELRAAAKPRRRSGSGAAGSTRGGKGAKRAARVRPEGEG